MTKITGGEGKHTVIFEVEPRGDGHADNERIQEVMDCLPVSISKTVPSDLFDEKLASYVKCPGCGEYLKFQVGPEGNKLLPDNFILKCGEKEIKMEDFMSLMEHIAEKKGDELPES